jgi:5-methylcytosine-specific restriction endonuclease McrA
MNSRYINAELRELVAVRAGFICEYCLISEDDTYFGCQVEHIISLKHSGLSNPENLAYSCVYCNRFKGSDIGSVSVRTRELIRFYNPRTDSWLEHSRSKKVLLNRLPTSGKRPFAFFNSIAMSVFWNVRL